uniref:HKT11 transporter n=1 Tax=Oryza nivara TaxID=4536 RepID=A0A172ZN58_ORYNI|nr:HKT1;1 transporter [Oryza sativa f. spontanea]
MKLLLPNSEVPRIYWEKAQHLCGFLSMKLISRARCVASSVKQSYSFLVCKSNPSVVQLVYFVIISFAGFLALKNLKPQGKPGPKDLDLLFTSVSTLTVSSMATVEMEDLSDRQLWVLILLMLMGGEVFTSMLGLYFNNANANRNENSQRSLPSISLDIEFNSPANNGDHKITECGQSEETMSQNQKELGPFAPSDPADSSRQHLVFTTLAAMRMGFGEGYSLGYSCQKLLKPDATCKDASYGFVGRWTEEGKLIVILVMFLGRLKEFILK